MSLKSVAEKEAFYLKTLSKEKLKYIESLRDSIHILRDTNGDGIADFAQIFDDGFAGRVTTALWISRVKHGIKKLDALVTQGLIQEKDLVELKVSQDFLLRVPSDHQGFPQCKNLGRSLRTGTFLRVVKRRKQGTTCEPVVLCIHENNESTCVVE